MTHHLSDFAPLVFKGWAVVLPVLCVALIVDAVRGAREDLGHAFRDRSER